MKKERKKRLVDVKIESYSPRGNGLATYQHPEGMQWTLEVPFARTGDYVRAMLIKKKVAFIVANWKRYWSLHPNASRRNAFILPHVEDAVGSIQPIRNS